MKNWIFSGLMLLIASTTYGQNAERKNFIGDTRIDTVLMLHKLQNQKFPVVEGYRIQIYKETGNSALDSAWSVKKHFENKYAGVRAYISFREPYYRVRVGDFRTRLEALHFLDRIKRDYPYAWEIKDMIRVKPPETVIETDEPPKTP